MMDRPFSNNAEGAANSGFTLVALHSADRMNRSLSPWTRQMLGDEPGVGMARHTVLNRVLRRRSQGSASFPSTLSILRRFHRIVTRSTAWKVGVGSVDPNLFDRFVTDLVKRQQLGANNIPSLISLGEQRRREMDMPLAGAIGEISPSSGSASTSASAMASQMGLGAPGAAPAPAENKPLTMEEIKRRIEEAKRFKSNTPGSVPDFVRAAQQPAPRTPSAGPTPPSLPPGVPPGSNKPMSDLMGRAGTPPMPRPAEASNPQPTETNTPPADQRVPPRLRRRRFASVEYVSLPNMDEDQNADKDEPSSPWRFGTGPPDDLAQQFTQWIEPLADPDTLNLPALRSQRTARPRTVAPFRREPLTAQRTIRALVRPAPHTGQSKRIQRRRKPARFPVSLGDPLIQTNSAIAHRPLTRLMDSLSGHTLAGRPHNLMAQVLRKDVTPPALSIDAPMDRHSFVPSARPPVMLDEIQARSPFQRGQDQRLRLPTSRLLAISPDDFALTPPLYLRQQRQTAGDAPPTEGVGAPMLFAPSQPRSMLQRTRQPQQTPQPAAPTIANPRHLRPSARPPALSGPESTAQRSTPRFQHRRPATAPVNRLRSEEGRFSLAQLQVMPSAPLPILAVQEPLALSAGRLDRSFSVEPVFAPLIGAAVQQSALPRPPAQRQAVETIHRAPPPASSLAVNEPDFVARRMMASTSRQVSDHIRAATSNRSFHLLAGALSGQMLASRPQTLMAQILAPETRQAETRLVATPRPQGETLRRTSSAASPLVASKVEDAQFLASAVQPSGRLVLTQPLPISVDDFVLAPSRRTPRTAERAIQVDADETAANSQPGFSVQRRVTPTSQSQPRVRLTAWHRRPQPREARRAQSGVERPVLAQLQAALLSRATRLEARTRLSSLMPLAPVSASPFEPVSVLWRQAQLAQPEVTFAPRRASPSLAREERQQTAPPVTSIQTPSRTPAGERASRSQRTAAQVIPLELAMRRLLGPRATATTEDRPAPSLPQGVGRVIPRSTQPLPTLGTRDQGSGTGKRELGLTPPGALPSPRSIRRNVERESRTLERPLRRPPSAQPPQPSPTLMERVLLRDFAGARVRTVSLPPTAADDGTLRPESWASEALDPVLQSRPSASAISLLRTVDAAPLTLAPRPLSTQFAPLLLQRQAASSNLEPVRQTPLMSDPAPLPTVDLIPHRSMSPSTVRRHPAPTLRPDLPRRPAPSVGVDRPLSPVSSPSRPHLTRQLSQRLVQLSQPREEPTTAAAEESVTRLASSALAARRFAPASHAWRPRAATPSVSMMPVQPRVRPTRRAQPVSAEAESSTARPPIHRDQSVQRSAPRAEGVDADVVRSLLAPGTLSIETLSDSSLLQRPAPAMGTPLTDFVLARVDGGQRVRTSQPALSTSPLQALPAPFSPLRPVQSSLRVEGVARRARPDREPTPAPLQSRRVAQQTGRISTPRVEPVPDLDLRQAVQSMADKPQRYKGVEPVSQLWRSQMLAAVAPVEPPSILLPAPTMVERVRRRRLSSSADDAPSLQRQIVERPVARSTAERQPMPLASAARSTDRSPVRRTGIQVVAPEMVTEAAASLPHHRRAVELQSARVRPLHSLPPSRREQPQTTGPQMPRGLVRRRVIPDATRSTLLERVAARDFADLRQEQLAAGPLALSAIRPQMPPSPTPSPLEEGIASAISSPAFSTARVHPLSSPRQMSKELVQRSGLSDYPNLGSALPRSQPMGTDFEPVSRAWPRLEWRQPLDDQPLDMLSSPTREDGAPVVRRATAQVIPLELVMRRLLGSRARADLTVTPAGVGEAPRSTPTSPRGEGRVLLPVAVAPMVARMEQQGWRFKRTARTPQSEVTEVRRSVESLGRERSRPLARPVRTLMERVLGRDFAGVRVQTASMAPLGIEAATRGDTVYLSPETARLDRAQSLGVLAHELTHVAARGRQPGAVTQRQTAPLMLSPRRVYSAIRVPTSPDRPEAPTAAGRSAPTASFPASDAAAPPVRVERSVGQQIRIKPAPRRPGAPVVARRSAAPSPLRPHLTRQLSQRLVQMSLAQEERTAKEVEAAVVRLASSAQAVRRFAPASHIWRSSLFEESPNLAAVEEADLSRVAAPRPAEPLPAPSITTGRGRVSRLPSLDLSARIAPSTRPSDGPVQGSGGAISTQRQAASMSAGDRPERNVAQRSPATGSALPSSSAPLVQPERTVAALEEAGWRFKRAERPRLAAPDRIQRAVAQLQQRADRGMPLPRQPRTLMERVLQRDFSKVRVQTAPLEALGVEAAARDNTVYLAREQASRLDRAENLALLGHELTHVAASGNAPVQRTTTTPGDLPVVQRRPEDGSLVQRTPQPQPALPLRPLLPATIQRSLAGEESVAADVEAGLRTFLRQSSQSAGEATQPSGAAVRRSTLPVVQRTPLAARSSARNGQERVQRLTAVDENDSALPRSGVSPAQLKTFRGGEPTLSGVPSVSMDVAPRTPIIRRMPAQEDDRLPEVDAPTSEKSAAITPAPISVQPTREPIVQRASGDEKDNKSENSGTDDFLQGQPNLYGDEQEPDWDHLAEKVYPFIRRMLLLERERRPR